MDSHPRDMCLIHGPSTTRTISHKDWNTPAEHLSWEWKQDTMGFHSNELNPVFSKEPQGQKHHWWCVFVDTFVWYIYSISVISKSCTKNPLVQKGQATRAHPFPLRYVLYDLYMECLHIHIYTPCPWCLIDLMVWYKESTPRQVLLCSSNTKTGHWNFVVSDIKWVHLIPSLRYNLLQIVKSQSVTNQL